jgi:uncharacterized protein (DUF1501 family)
MNKSFLSSASRRAFLQHAGQFSLAGVAAPMALNLATMAEAAAQSSSSQDYKALVCVFLYGGNDHSNTLPPYDAINHAKYLSARGVDDDANSLGIQRALLEATALTPLQALSDSRQLALAPGLAPLKSLFETQKMGVLLNIGSLAGPLSLTEYKEGTSKNMPPSLGSHNDQQSYWQSSQTEGSTSGWGGRIGDLIEASSGKSSFTCMNAYGNAVFGSGTSSTQFRVSSGGALPLNSRSSLFGSSAASQALQSLITDSSRAHLFEAEHTRVTARSLGAFEQLDAALKLSFAPESRFKNVDPLGDNFNSLAAQLRMVAKLIAGRNTLGVKRQVFLVGMGGFDTHDGLVSEHPGLMVKVGDALKSFYDATVDLGVENNVTTFTGSEFGRTLSGNGKGSDHGWGGHHFVLGGSVKGQRFYGELPEMGFGHVQDIGNGRLLPTMAVDQLSATLAKWMGFSDIDLLKHVAPNIQKYTVQDLNLLNELKIA